MHKHLKLGQMVYSKAGRDRGRCYLVIGYENERWVKVSDGDYRPVNQPKIKNVVHVKAVDGLANDINQRLLDGQNITDELIRAALAELHNDLSRKEGD